MQRQAKQIRFPDAHPFPCEHSVAVWIVDATDGSPFRSVVEVEVDVGAVSSHGHVMRRRYNRR